MLLLVTIFVIVPVYHEIKASQLTFDNDEDGDKILLGSGSYGIVYLPEIENANVAIKCLHKAAKKINQR